MGRRFLKLFLLYAYVKNEPLLRPHATPGDYDLNKLVSYLPDIASTQDTAFLARWNLIKSISKKFLYLFLYKNSTTNCAPTQPEDRNLNVHYLRMLPNKFQLFGLNSFCEEEQFLLSLFNIGCGLYFIIPVFPSP